ncbi:MAG: Xaa-Pro peptidase family protein [Aggregatilineales bacterium]
MTDIQIKHQEQRQRTVEMLKSQGLTRALFTHPNTFLWLTGFAPPAQMGVNPFNGGPSLVYVEDGHFTIIAIDNFAGGLAGLQDDPDCTLATYTGFTIENPLNATAKMLDTLAQATGGTVIGRIGVERFNLPLSIVTAMGTTAEFVALDSVMPTLREVKTAEEIALLRENFHLSDVGHAAARQAVVAGNREVDVFAAVSSAIYKEAGQFVPIGNDFIVGYRQANIGAMPDALEIRPHDSFIADISTTYGGYWSDSCATYYAESPTEKQRKLHQTVTDALDFAISLIKPGAVAGDIDAQVRDFMRKAGHVVYPHHTGHGVGVMGHEAPRIVPDNPHVLRENMVIMLEPGIYFPGETSIRLEDAVLVTADGCAVLTSHDKSI